MWSGARPGFYKTCLFLSCFSVIQVLSPSSSYSNITPPVKPPVDTEDLTEEEGSEQSLADTLKQGLTGLSLESAQVQEVMRQNAQWFARTRPDWRYASVRERTLRGCEKDLSRKPFCIVLKDLNRKEVGNSRRRSLFAFLKSIHSRYEINSWIKQGNVERLSTTSESEVRAALRKENSYSRLEKLVSQTIASPSCSSASFSHLLGTKVEEFLPDPSVQQAAMQLYGKAASCGNSESSNRARYRLSLFYIWKDQCKSALPHLDFLTAHSTNNDYRSRALFWKIHCQGEQVAGNPVAGDTTADANEKARENARKTLIEKYPFNFHTLLVQKESSFQKLPITLKSDSEIQFRTSRNPVLNEKVKVIEALMAVKEVNFAKEIMDRIQDDVDKTEPEFRLYIGVLYSRLNYHIKNFRLLSKVFRENPEMISKAALEVYFPKNPVQVNALGQHEIDAKLLLSLIRQESAFNTRARSSAGAIGLMQLMPATARRFERIRSYDRLFDPALNLKIGSRYFSGLLEQFGGDAELALAAYNAGPHRVDQWLVRYPVKNRILFLDLIPFKETREYVASIARNYFWYANLYPNALQAPRDVKVAGRVAQRGLGEVFRFLGTPGQYTEVVIP